ncbi:MAG: permease [Acidobacteriota bacterium]
MKERHKLILVVAVFLAAYFLPVDSVRFGSAVIEAFHMLKEYAREHVLFCLVPAFFIAGAITTFTNRGAVMRYLGPDAPKPVSYGVASVSGSILAVCSCTVLPLFAGIWKRGAGIGPASAFLYSGPAINILAMILTARVLGLELGLARVVGAVAFACVIGLLMGLIFGREKDELERTGFPAEPSTDGRRAPWQDLVYFVSMIAVLVFATWGKPARPVGFFNAVHEVHWYLAGLSLIVLVFAALRWFDAIERRSWLWETWTFTKQIFPLLIGGVLVAGFLLGRPQSGAGVIPMQWVQSLLGGNSLGANLFASVAGAFMYFATLTEVPILQGLLGAGMGKGPALALLLAGPALSLPSMIVIRNVMGTKKSFTYFALVIVMAALSGWLFGWLF